VTETLVLDAPPVARDARIRDLFVELGSAMATAPFTHECIRAGIWTADELEAMAFRSCQNEVRRSLTKKDPVGLPFAGQTVEEDGSGQVWKQRAFWEYPDYAYNISMHIQQRDESHSIAILMVDECADRFGTAPEIASLEGR
jgi:hypothetical protein